MRVRMDSGKYYVGDLCYVFSDTQWDEVCSLIFPYPAGPNRNKRVDGRFVLSDGTEFCIYGTAYGDGLYTDGRDREYFVDSGTIGCVNTKFLKKKALKAAPSNGSHVVDMPVDFDCDEDTGVMTFGPVRIDTSGND